MKEKSTASSQKQIKAEKTNIRVHELAKQYNLTSKDLITEIETYGIVVKTHMSSLSPEDVKLIEEQRNLKSKSRETSVPLTTEDAEKPETKKAPQAEKKSKVNQHKHTTKKEKKKSKRERTRKA